MGSKIRSGLALCCLAFATGVSGAQTNTSNQVPILVYWVNTPPTGVAFQDARRGSIPFDRERDHFRGVRPVRGSWAFHDLALAYGQQEAPLALRTRYDAPSIRLEVALPTAASCTPAGVNSLRRVSENAPYRTRLTSMLAARHLLELRANVCPAWAQRDLAEIYFNMNCSLAKSTDYFRLSEEVKERYLQYARNAAQARQRIEACENQTRGVTLAALLDLREQAFDVRDLAMFEAINGELATYYENDDWRGGFVAQHISLDAIRAAQLRGLYARQIEAGRARDYATALGYNGQLLRLKGDNSFDAAFGRISLSREQLETDRAFLETRANTPPEP